MVGNWIRRAEIGKTDWFCPDCFSEWSDWKRHDECPYCHGGPPTPVDQAKFPETPDEFFEAAARVFGVTQDPKLAGWILPDGTMLAFSTSGILRDRDHREVAGLFGGQQQGWEAIKAFMDMGAIRVGQGSVTLSKNPTTEQKDALWIYFQSHSRAGYGLLSRVERGRPGRGGPRADVAWQRLARRSTARCARPGGGAAISCGESS